MRVTWQQVVLSKDVLRLLLIDQELEGDRGSVAKGSLIQEVDVRHAHDDGVGAAFINPRVPISFHRLPLNLSDQTLCVRALVPVWLLLISSVAEGAARVLREDFIEVLKGLWCWIWSGADLVPEVFQLLLPALDFV